MVSKQTSLKEITSQRVILTSFLVDLSDILINTAIALASGSVVMFSQALEGGADLLASGLLLLGVKRAKLPPDKKHPFGYGKELYFWVFLAALATFTITAGTSFYYGFKRFLHPKPIENLPLAFLGLAIAIGTNSYAASLSLKRLLGKRSLNKIRNTFVNSALIATKTALVLDVMGTSASILGLAALVLYQLTGNLRFDGLGAMAIGVTLAILALYIIKSAKDLLLGQSASPEVEKKIIKTAESFPAVKKVLDLRTLRLGTRRLLVNMEVHLIDKLTTDEIEHLIDKVEKAIRKKVPSATSIQIELETPDI